MKIEVICCNDSIEACAIGSEEEIKAILDQLKKEHFAKKHYTTFEVYENIWHWHVHTTELICGEDVIGPHKTGEKI